MNRRLTQILADFRKRAVRPDERTPRKVTTAEDAEIAGWKERIWKSEKQEGQGIPPKKEALLAADSQFGSCGGMVIRNLISNRQEDI